MIPTPKSRATVNEKPGLEKGLPDEPRNLIYHGFALQIINSSTAKNRYLLLMDDILVIAKPISRDSHQSYSLNSPFLVKHIIDLSGISFSASREKDRGGRKVKEDVTSRSQKGELPPVIASTIRKFNMNPYEGIMYMIDKGALRADPLSISSFLVKTNELSRRQIGKFLGMQSNHAILLAFLDRCKLTGLRIDDALRVFLASFRLPGDGNTIDYLIGTFARRWHRANASILSFDVETCTKLAFFMMALNSDMHNRKNASKAIMEFGEFAARFQALESSSTVPENTLAEIYQAIRHDKLETAMDVKDNLLVPIDIKLPVDHHLAINESSALITISVPALDKDLRIKPVGDGLVCDIPILDFTYTNCHTFTVRPTSLGRKSLVFIKLGSRSRKYTSVPAWSLVVEPPFKQHTFQIGFPAEAHKHPRKKFMFGVESSTERTLWLEKITTTFAKTFNHTNPELEVIIRRLRKHFITEDPSRFLILSGHELVQYLQTPFTTTLPEPQISAANNHPINVFNKSSYMPPLYPPVIGTSTKAHAKPHAPQAHGNRIRARNGSLGDSVPGPQMNLAVSQSNSSGKLKYSADSSSTTSSKFRVRAG
ncbi:SEC7-like protein [Basidiobolus meristosporus CBS 931.73]|uniref:SEC7-like protein n=1 Tax=Basidiobolus meristosporus CBS 931.73 TaxID=1314790 RepID=A0A1Y1Y5W8_9FUNG|nr:SEC7-like protein [Basidiobolus meristosporus CBS 931.73]|eukprot:ORX93359.1 SEC7-like protein [Basidiobolus meristosporus CBS 931.73]